MVFFLLYLVSYKKSGVRKCLGCMNVLRAYILAKARIEMRVYFVVFVYLRWTVLTGLKDFFFLLS